MPAVPIEPGLPTLYLDWSHLCEACKAPLSPGGDWSPLVELLHAGRANLCASAIHLFELLAWPDKRLARQVADAMDELPIVWMDSGAERIELLEAKDLLLRELGAAIAPYSPFHRGFLSLFHRGLTPAHAADMLARPTVAALFADNQDRDMQPVLSQSIGQAREYAQDRSRAADDGYSDDEIEQILADSLPHAVSRVLEHAHDALRQEDGYRAHRIGRPTDVEVRQAIRRLVDNDQALPAFRTYWSALNAFALRIRKQDPASRGFAGHRSAWFDLLHCGAGAYCDVFTCDARTSEDLGNARTQLGRHRQLTERETRGPGGLVGAIQVQLDTTAARR